MRKHIKCCFCIFLAVLLLSQEVFAAVEPVATPGNLEDLEDIFADFDFSDLPELQPDFISSLTPEQYEAYCQSFIDHPSYLLDYPEGVPQPRFVATLSAATVWVLCILAAAVGIVFAANVGKWLSGSDGYTFFSGFEMYMRAFHAADEAFWEAWDMIFLATWGSPCSGMLCVYKALREYCKKEVDGYGTDAPSYTVPAFSSLLDMPFFVSPDIAGYLGSSYLSNGKPYDFVLGTSLRTFRLIGFITDSSILRMVYLNSSNQIITGSFYGYDSPTHKSTYGITFHIIFSDLFGVHSFDSEASAKAWFNDGDTSGIVYSPAEVSAITPERTIDEAQAKTFTAPADTITLPADEVTAEMIADQVYASTDIITLAGVLESVWALGEAQTDAGTGEDTEDQVYPWVPDITGWLEKLKAGLDALGEKVTAIPDAIAGLGDAITAIPEQIADFFTIDTAAISASFAGIQDTFSAKFPILGQLQGIFSYKNQSFDQTPPIFTMQVPACLKFAYPDTDVIVVLDLTQYASYFRTARALLAAAIWLLFAQWVLNEFNIKFHVG